MSVLQKLPLFPFAVEGRKKLGEIPDLPTFENESVAQFMTLYAQLCEAYFDAIKTSDEETKVLLIPFFSKIIKESTIKEVINRSDKDKLETWFDAIVGW